MIHVGYFFLLHFYAHYAEENIIAGISAEIEINDAHR